MRARRRTRTIGGAALIAAGIVRILQSTMLGSPGSGLVLAIVGDLLWAGGVVLLAVGLSRDGSVVARRPLGITGASIVALWPLAHTLCGSLFGHYLWLLLPLAAALVAASEVARAGTAPRPWRFAPLWVLAVRVVADAVPMLIGVTDPHALVDLIPLVSALGMLATLAATLGLGILALVLAGRPGTGTVPVYRGEAAD